MGTLAAWLSRELEWDSLEWLGRRYVLRAGGDEVARLTTTGLFRRAAEFEAPGVRWQIRSTRWLLPELRVLEDGRPIATYRGRWFGGGTLELLHDRSVSAAGVSRNWQWRRRGLRRRQFLEDGVPVVSLWRKLSWARRRVGARVERDSLPERDALILVAAGFYLMLRTRRGRP